MAVIYLDGNSFTGIRQDNCKSKEKLTEFSDYLKDRRRAMLRELLRTEITQKPEWLSQKGNYRIETLLWGGDEIIWVVPAWQGWTTLAFFYRCARDWKFGAGAGLMNQTPTEQNSGAPGKGLMNQAATEQNGGAPGTGLMNQAPTGPVRLTHAGGLVFCHHNAPIHQITRLAQTLAGIAKDQSRKQNLFAYEVLESFDNTGSELDAARKTRLPQNAGVKTLVLPGEGMEDAVPVFSRIKQVLPRRQVFRIVEQLRREPERVGETINAATGEITRQSHVAEDLAALKTYLGAGPVFWVHVAELWDYIAPEREAD